jgi:hypothetical protein
MRQILEGAWDDWTEMPKRAIFSARSRASMIFDFIRARALAEFNGDPNIRIITKGQTVQFLFKDRVLVRFKKANERGIGSNIVTQAVIQFIDPQMTIPGLLPEVYRVEVCYRLDSLATQMETLAVTARERNRRLWSYELQRPAAAEVIPLPAPEGPAPTPPEVTIRKPSEKPETGE